MEAEKAQKDADIKLLFKAIGAGDLATVREFIHYIDVNQKDDFGASLLHHAASGRNPSIARTLLESKANPDAKDQNQWTPLHTACSNANIEVRTFNVHLKQKRE